MSKRKQGTPRHGFVPPPHANAEPHRKLMAWLDTASNAEIMALSVKAGIYDKRGNLMKWYR